MGSKLQFTKMHGIGNDFVMINALGGASALQEEIGQQAAWLCDRKFGVGADGVILILPSDTADLRMRMFNPDGTEAEMCGNGIRCFAKFAYDKGLTQNTILQIETGAGILETRARVSEGCVDLVTVDMGEAHLAPAEIPVTLAGAGDGPIVAAPLTVEGREYAITCVSMGNPHCVVFVDDVASFPVTEIGPKFERDPAFPRRINTEFVQVLGDGEVRMRVWERGAGETLACGTGACAVGVASALNGKTGRDVLVHLAGGDLQIAWRDDNRVMMTGPAATVFEGVI